jgi:hypothetical protein
MRYAALSVFFASWGVLVVLAAYIAAPFEGPRVERPRTAEFGTCVDPATDSEVERCGGDIPWATDLIAFHEFGLR